MSTKKPAKKKTRARKKPKQKAADSATFEFFSMQSMEGIFWGLLETRPYMRARAGLAECLWAVGRREEAVAHFQDLLWKIGWHRAGRFIDGASTSCSGTGG